MEAIRKRRAGIPAEIAVDLVFEHRLRQRALGYLETRETCDGDPGNDKSEFGATLH
jgi:hypothetical protein